MFNLIVAVYNEKSNEPIFRVTVSSNMLAFSPKWRERIHNLGKDIQLVLRGNWLGNECNPDVRDACWPPILSHLCHCLHLVLAHVALPQPDLLVIIRQDQTINHQYQLLCILLHSGNVMLSSIHEWESVCWWISRLPYGTANTSYSCNNYSAEHMLLNLSSTVLHICLNVQIRYGNMKYTAIDYLF